MASKILSKNYDGLDMYIVNILKSTCTYYAIFWRVLVLGGDFGCCLCLRCSYFMLFWMVVCIAIIMDKVNVNSKLYSMIYCTQIIPCIARSCLLSTHHFHWCTTTSYAWCTPYIYKMSFGTPTHAMHHRWVLNDLFIYFISPLLLVHETCDYDKMVSKSRL